MIICKYSKIVGGPCDGNRKQCHHYVIHEQISTVCEWVEKESCWYAREGKFQRDTRKLCVPYDWVYKVKDWLE